MNNNTGRKRVRRARKNESIKRILLTVCMMAMIAAISIGGTLAWLTDSTSEVKNVFTPTTIGVELTESDSDADGKLLENEYVMVPGKTIEKDPTVTYKANSVAGYLFVKLEKSSNFDDFMSYDIADGWTQLQDVDGNDVDGVYYREMAATTTDSDPMSILADDQVKVNPDVTKKDMDALTEATYPTLKVTAYAIQSEYLETSVMYEIWELAQPIAD